MRTILEEEPKQITIADLFPDLPEPRLSEVRKTFDDYCGLLLKIFERLERERRQSFDDDLLGP